ncbi:UDP-N-acetylglucosamine 1-carboxyvinyltransferase [Patescibacteria group bacterium]|nr:UDP-N-acetylglucosamine 1-carboxyvinyltransferase [Patescibacteria group bacterium]
MSKYIIHGGLTLSGEVSIRGAKNASWKEIIASMLTQHSVQITNIPQISDVRITESIAKSLGAKILKTGEHSIEISTPTITNSTVPHGTGEKSRSSFMFAAPLLIRTGKAIIPLPGGDKLGARPLDRLFDCFKAMNIHTDFVGDTVVFSTEKIRPTTYTFPKPSHTVTEVLIMTAALVDGQTILNNAAREPEIDDLVEMLNSMGAKIKRHPTDPGQIIIDGVPWLSPTKHQVIADRNEAVTFAVAALATEGSVNILRINPEIIKNFLDKVQQMGARVETGRDEVTVSWTKRLRAIDIETEPEPGFMTDWQAVFSVLLTQAHGCSTLIERIFPSRFQHIPTLEKMGAKIKFFNPKIKNPETYYHFNLDSDRPDYFHGVKIYGPSELKPINVAVNDLRAGACTTIAALAATGESVIDNVEFIERGYEKLAERLVSLGANIEYIKI